MDPLYDWPLVSQGGRVTALIGRPPAGAWLMGGLIDHSQVVLSSVSAAVAKDFESAQSITININTLLR